MPLSESDTRAKLIDPAIHARGWTEDLIRREETAGAIEIVDGQPSKRSRGRVDYTLRVKVNPDTQPIAVALIEAKANLLFFTKGRPTEKVWYYDLSAIKVGKKTPLTADHFEEFLRLLPDRADSDHSWTVTRAEIEAKGLDLKAVNPHAKAEEDTRTPEQLLDLIEAKGREVAEALAALHRQ